MHFFALGSWRMAARRAPSPRRSGVDLSQQLTNDEAGMLIMCHWFVVHRQNKRPSPLAAGFKGFLVEAALMTRNQAAPLSSIPSS